MKKIIFYLVLLFVPWVMFTASAPVYSAPYAAESMEGWVMDRANKRPLAGVIVTVNWELVGQDGSPAGQMMAMETVTDKAGRFYFPGWNSKKILQDAYLNDSAPQLLLFKHGYEFKRLINQTSANSSGESTRKSDWSAKTIELDVFKDSVVQIGDGVTLSKYAVHLSGLNARLYWAYLSDNCEWKQIPRMIAAIHRAKMEWDRQGIRNDLKTIDHLRSREKCGSAQEFFRSHLP